MAAANWQIYYAARKHLADGGFNLATDTLMISLFASDSNGHLTLSTIGSIMHEIQGGGYTPPWGQGASAFEMRLAASAVTWLATGGDINDVKYAVVWKLTASARACKLLAVTSFEPPMAAVAGHVIGIGVPAGIFDLN